MRILLLIISLCLAAGVGADQSLSELAKKEKERREANAKAGRAAVVEAEGVGAASPDPEPTEQPEDGEAPPEPTQVEELEKRLEETEKKLEQIEKRKLGEAERAASREAEEEEVGSTSQHEANTIAFKMSTLASTHESELRRCRNEPIGRSGVRIMECTRAKDIAEEYSVLRKKLFALEGSAIVKRKLPSRLRR